MHKGNLYCILLINAPSVHERKIINYKNNEKTFLLTTFFLLCILVRGLTKVPQKWGGLRWKDRRDKKIKTIDI